MMIQSRYKISRISIVMASLLVALTTVGIFIVPNHLAASQTNITPPLYITSSSTNNYPPGTLSETNTLYIPFIFHDYMPPSWTFLGPDNVNVATFEVDPLLSDTIYAGTYDNGLWRTQNGGQSWEILSNGIPTTYSVRHIAMVPTTPTTIYASVDNSYHWVYLSSNGGEYWEPLTPPANLRIYSLGVNPVTPTIVYAGIGILDLPNYGGHVMRSLDGGISWEQILPYYTLANKIVIDPENPETVYIASSSAGVLKSLDGGDNWQTMNEGLPSNPSATQLALDANDPLVIYLSGTGGLYNSIDGGENWVNISQSLPQNYYSDFAFNNDAGTIFIATRSSTQPNPDCEGGIYRSSDNGVTWQYVINNPNNLCAKKISFIDNGLQQFIFMLIGNYSNEQIWRLTPINP